MTRGRVSDNYARRKHAYCVSAYALTELLMRMLEHDQMDVNSSVDPGWLVLLRLLFAARDFSL